MAQTGYWSEPVPVPEISTTGGETYPFISADGNILLWNAQGTICMSHWNGTSWNPREILPEPVNDTAGLENASAITPDHRFIYWVSWRPGDHGGWDIWRCSWDENTNTFGVAECLGGNVNSEYYEWGMCFTPDGQRMYFLSNVHFKNGQYGQGDMDIWYCDWDSTLGDWGLPSNIGRPVNAASLEDTPHYNLINIGNTPRLYFCSDWGHGVPGWQGSLEIFYATWDGQHWSDVTNVGVPINSPVEDESPCLTPDGGTMYFVTRENRVPYAIKHIMVSHWKISDIEETPANNDTLPEIDLFPNPSNLTLSIRFDASICKYPLELRIYDINGKEVKNLGKYESGNCYSIKWGGRTNSGVRVTSGVYFLKVQGENNKVLKKSFSFIK